MQFPAPWKTTEYRLNHAVSLVYRHTFYAVISGWVSDSGVVTTDITCLSRPFV